MRRTPTGVTQVLLCRKIVFASADGGAVAASLDKIV
jgi:hypothetical protein